jgi:hypothetical protein
MNPTTKLAMIPSNQAAIEPRGAAVNNESHMCENCVPGRSTCAIAQRINATINVDERARPAPILERRGLFSMGIYYY